MWGQRQVQLGYWPHAFRTFFEADCSKDKTINSH